MISTHEFNESETAREEFLAAMEAPHHQDVPPLWKARAFSHGWNPVYDLGPIKGARNVLSQAVECGWLRFPDD